MRFYKQMYLIAIYDLYDNLIHVFDNVREYAQAYQLDVRDATSKVGRMARGRSKTFYHRNIQYTLKLIPLAKKEIKELSQLKN